jgi:predicted metal-dependent hydrolase
MENDPTLVDGRASFTAFYVRGRRGTLPATGALLRSIPRYLSRTYHPSQEASTAQAVAYLASSPAALAAESATTTADTAAEGQGKSQGQGAA